jgi:hypothetical protein
MWITGILGMAALALFIMGSVGLFLNGQNLASLH